MPSVAQTPTHKKVPSTRGARAAGDGATTKAGTKTVKTAKSSTPPETDRITPTASANAEGRRRRQWEKAVERSAVSPAVGVLEQDGTGPSSATDHPEDNDFDTEEEELYYDYTDSDLTSRPLGQPLPWMMGPQAIWGSGYNKFFRDQADVQRRLAKSGLGPLAQPSGPANSHSTNGHRGVAHGRDHLGLEGLVEGRQESAYRFRQHRRPVRQ